MLVIAGGLDCHTLTKLDRIGNGLMGQKSMNPSCKRLQNAKIDLSLYYENPCFRPWESENPGETQGCGSVNKLAKLLSNQCEDAKPFVCQRPISVTPSCTEGWDHHGKSCYKVKQSTLNP
jgi:hypothetical protein